MDRNAALIYYAEGDDVVPYVGTWIEINTLTAKADRRKNVVPYVGTWIEIFRPCRSSAYSRVVPYVGTWIEILGDCDVESGDMSRSLRGNVDRNLRSRK